MYQFIGNLRQKRVACTALDPFASDRDQAALSREVWATSTERNL